MGFFFFTDFGCGGGDEFEYVGHWGPAESVFCHDFGLVFGGGVQAADVVGHAVGELFTGHGREDYVVPFVPHAVVAVNGNGAKSLVLLQVPTSQST